MIFWLALVFGVIGAVGGEWFGLLVGAGLGGLLGAVLELRRRVTATEAQLARLVVEVRAEPAQPVPRPAGAALPDVPSRPAPSIAAAPRVGGAADRADPARASGWSAANDSPMARAAAGVRGFFTPYFTPYFTSGNVVAKVGVVVLFFGVAFLLKYAYDIARFPPALRLAAAALGGATLLMIGWRLRTRADAYGLLLQGAGIGIVYLTVFAAARLYGLLPLAAAFAIMAVIVAASCILAVLQNSEPLAVLGMTGGFLAPVLTASEAGSHVALFAYYELLNLGILAMAAFRVWRWLNWTGFLFTFVTAGVWGARAYRPEYFATTEPFLVVFFLHYVGVIVLTTRQRALALRTVVDGSLVFGLPIVAFGLQAALVADMHFGLAFSALGVAAVYVVAPFGMRRAMAVPAVISDSFVALALIFASLAVPLALDNQRWTAAAWAVEGAGLVWVGLRQQRAFHLWFGLLLQCAAGAAFAWGAFADIAGLPVFNSFFLGCALIAVAGGFTSLQFTRYCTPRPRRDAVFSSATMVWGVLWWLGGVARECASAAPARAQVHTFALVAAVSLMVLGLLGQRLRWRAATLAALAWLPLFALVWAFGVLPLTQSPLAHAGWLTWPLCGAALWICLHLVRRVEPPASATLLDVWHGCSLLLGTAVLSWLVARALEVGAGSASVWTEIVWASPTISVVAALPRLTQQRWWPMPPHAAAYWAAGAILAGVALLWLLLGGLVTGDPAPLPYVPIINPLELAQAAALLAAWHFIAVWFARRGGDAVPARALVVGCTFVWLNMSAARSVHFFGGIAFDVETLWRAAAFQASLSLLWSSLALIVMLLAARRRARPWWIGGAALLGAVVLKLLIIDLSDIGTVARIVSFMGVGALMLLIGYIAPLPEQAGPSPEQTGAPVATGPPEETGPRPQDGGPRAQSLAQGESP